VSLDYTLKSWDPQSLEELSSIRAHKRGIVSVSSYKGYVLTGCKDGSIKYWKDQSAFTIQAHNSLSCLSTLSDSILSGGENIKVWEGLQLVHEYADYVAFSLLPLFSHTFISGGKNKLSLFDTRTDSEVSDFLSVGPFVSCSKWDDFSFWSLSDIGLIVFSI
jgi:WD40 repeat protein